MLYKIFFMFCFIKSIQASRDKVKLQVYYETYDFDSRLFIATELKEAVDLLATQYVEVELYSYGNAETKEVDGKYVFTCEHGEEECLGNRFDACAVDTLDIHSAIDLINCIIDPFGGLNGEYEFDTYAKCWYILDIYTTGIQKCSVSERGAQLLKKNGEATDLVAPKQLPYVLINGKEWSIDDNVSLIVALCETLAETDMAPPNCF